MGSEDLAMTLIEPRLHSLKTRPGPSSVCANWYLAATDKFERRSAKRHHRATCGCTIRPLIDASGLTDFEHRENLPSAAGIPGTSRSSERRVTMNTEGDARGPASTNIKSDQKPEDDRAEPVTRRS